MKEHEHIERLLEKFVKNECNLNEIEKVVAYFKNAELTDVFPSVEDITKHLEGMPQLENRVSDETYSQLLEKAKRKEKKRDTIRRTSFWKYTSVAAIFLAVISVGYFFIQNSTDPASKVIFNSSEDHITLELEDGRIEIIQEDGSKQVATKNGQIVGNQDGSQLIYEKDIAIEKLTYNTLTVPHGKHFEIILSDGTKTHLNAGSSIRYPVKFMKGKDRNVFLSGEAFFDVARDTAHPFIVKADDLKIEVLGTQFNVSTYPEDITTDVVLVEGSVSMNFSENSTRSNSAIILEPGYKGAFNKAKKTIATQKTNTAIYTSWIEGNIVFRNSSFENILKRLERQYDVAIMNNASKLTYRTFNATFEADEETIEEVLDYLKKVHPFNYVIKNKKIEINPINRSPMQN